MYEIVQVESMSLRNFRAETEQPITFLKYFFELSLGFLS